MSEMNKNELIEALQSENEDLKNQVKELEKELQTFKDTTNVELDKLELIVNRLRQYT